MSVWSLIKSIDTPSELLAVGFILLSLIQISPIKIDPWTKILKLIGRSLNTEVMERLDLVDAENARYRIIRFADEIRCGQRHSEEHFNQIITDIDKYEAYCDNHPSYKNNKAQMAISRIKDTNRITKEENSFLV